MEDIEEEIEEDHKAYEPCACHNIQLVLKDGSEAEPKIDLLIKRVSKNIVSKSKFSAVIAEQLRQFGKKFLKRDITRFNSILFTARSIVSVSSIQFVTIRSRMPTKTKSCKSGVFFIKRR